MAGGQNQWPPNGGGGAEKAVMPYPGMPSGVAGYPEYGSGNGGFGGNYGFPPKRPPMNAPSVPGGWSNPMFGGGPTQWAGPNASYPNWNDDPSSGYANDVAMINAGPWPGGGGGGWGGGQGGGWGSPWTGGGGGFGPGLMWDVQDGPGSGMWAPPMRTFDFQDSNNNGVDDRDEPGYEYTRPGDEGYVGGTPIWDSGVEEGGGAASPFDWGSVGAGRLAKAQEYAALGKMGRAKQVFSSGETGGAWSPEIHQQLRTFKTGA